MGRAVAEREPAEFRLAGRSDGNAARRRHVAALAAEHRIDWRINPDRFHSGWADVPGRWIETGPLTDQAVYFVCLHEIGHVVEQLPGSDEHADGDTILDHEARAWLWALDHSREPIGLEAAFEAIDGLASYARSHCVERVPPALVEVVSRIRVRHPQLGSVGVRVWTDGGYVRIVLAGQPASSGRGNSTRRGLEPA